MTETFEVLIDRDTGEATTVTREAGADIGLFVHMPKLEALTVFGRMRAARLKLIGLDTPDKTARVRMIKDPETFKALIDLFYAVELFVSAPNEGDQFWHPPRAPMNKAERSAERKRGKLNE